MLSKTGSGSDCSWDNNLFEALGQWERSKKPAATKEKKKKADRPHWPGRPGTDYLYKFKNDKEQEQEPDWNSETSFRDEWVWVNCQYQIFQLKWKLFS